MQLTTYASLSAGELAASLLPLFRDEHAALFIHLFRTLTAFEMLTHADAYDRFLPGLEGLAAVRDSSFFAGGNGDSDGGAGGDGVPSMETVAQALVLRDGVDAEHLMIQALATLLELPLAVVYTGGAATVRVRLAYSVEQSRLCYAVRFERCPRPSPYLVYGDERHHSQSAVGCTRAIAGSRMHARCHDGEHVICWRS